MILRAFKACTMTISEPSLQVPATVHHSSGIRRFFSARVLALVALGFCVFTWGLQYKLSLYDSNQTASHQVPKAKMLSKDEQMQTAARPLVIRTRTSARVIYTIPAGDLLLLLFALNLPVLLAALPRPLQADRPWLLRLRALRNTLFVRPPPSLA